MKNLVNKVKEQLHPSPRPGLSQLVKQVLKQSEFDANDEKHLQEIIELLQKDIAQRVQLDIDKIRLSFFRFKFFHDLEEQMGAEIVNNLYRQLQYEKIPRRGIIFNLGDIGKKFYIILKGSVYVLVRKKGLQDGSVPDEEEEKKEEEMKRLSLRRATKKHSKRNKSQQVFMTQSSITVDEVLNHMSEQEFLETKFPYLHKVGIMNSGDSFGEIALTKQQPRSATIVAIEDTHLVTVTRDQFNKLLSAYYAHIQHLNVTFLQKIPIFSDWNEMMLNQLYYHFVFESKYLFQVIYQEGDEAKYIYLVKSGEIELSQQIEINHIGESDLTLQKFFNKDQNKYQRVKSSIINTGQIFGHEEILGNTLRKQKAVCQSQKATLFVLDKARFLTYFQKGGSIEKLQQFDLKKQSTRTKSLKAFREIQLVKPQLEQREIPYIEEKEKITDFVIPKTKNAIERVGTLQKFEGYQLLQGKGHVNKIHYNFIKNLDSIRKNMKSTEPLLLTSALFDVEANKGSTISIMNKVFPGACRPKYEIPNYSMSPKLVIRSLKLPKLLTDVESLIQNKPNQQSLKSFCTYSYTTNYQFKTSNKNSDLKQDDSSVIL